VSISVTTDHDSRRQAELSFEPRKIIEQMWAQGNLRGLLFDHQFDLYDGAKYASARKFVFHCSRRLGKSVVLLTLANEIGLTKPGAILRYGAASQKDVREIITPLMKTLTASCPEQLRPVWIESKQKYIYPFTQAEMVVTGCDEGRADNLRGTKCDWAGLDEAGFIDELEYVIKSILMPQFLTTDGRLVLSSTSPVSPDHYFVTLMEEAKDYNAYVMKTIHDDSRPEVRARIAEWMKESGGAGSTTWRREYLCEIITDETRALFPEFTDPTVNANVVRDQIVPEHKLHYTVGDLGYVDYAAFVFGYVDFLRGKKVIQDEVLLQRKNSKEIADEVKAKERELWDIRHENFGPMVPNVFRFADAQPLTIADFNELHNLGFSLVGKDVVEAQVNQLRLDLRVGKIEIHPRCVNTIRHLKYGVWNKNRDKFDRSADYGHFDLAAATIYFTRSVDLHHNPYPANYGLSHETHFIHPKEELSQTAGAFTEAFGIKR
jgi:hypothetical protein